VPTFFEPLIELLIRSDSIFDGASLPIALVLRLLTFVLVPSEERRRVREPFWFLVLYAALVSALWLVPERHPAAGVLELSASASLLFSIAGSVFALFVYSFWIRRVSQPLPKILRDVIKAFIYAGVVLLVLRSAGVEPGSLLATSAFLTAVIGLSLQDTLGNLFAGLAIQAQRPFFVGDWVEFDKQTGHIGKVIEINWRATRIMTLQRLEVTVPNATVAKSPIINYSRPTSLVRRDLEIHAPYATSPETVKRVLLGALDHVPDVIQRPEPVVFTKDFTDRGVTYLVLYYIEQFQNREVIDSSVRERLWYAMQRAGILIPVPRVQIDLRRESQGQSQDESLSASAQLLLSHVDLFSGVSEEVRKQIAKGARRKVYATEEVILYEGDRSTEMYVIERGHVRVELRSPSGTPQVIAELGRGDIFGEMSLMTGDQRAADVIATEETLVLALGRDVIAPVIEQHPSIAEHISRILAERRRVISELGEMSKNEDRASEHDQFEILRRIRKFFS
jgi:small-conductance mechanosensitive channel/CRP-like cAMP-binding protein